MLVSILRWSWMLIFPVGISLFVFKIYGYITSSDVRILALIERDGIIPLKKRKEIDIKILFVSFHRG
jgi:hypothetical protein